MKYMDWGNMRTGLEALYFLDNALTDPSEEYLRIIDKEENETYLKYIVDNGSGDTLYVIFTEDIVLIKGFAHESSLSQFAADEWNQDIIDGFYKGLDEKYQNLYSEEQKDETNPEFTELSEDQNIANELSSKNFFISLAYLPFPSLVVQRCENYKRVKSRLGKQMV